MKENKTARVIVIGASAGGFKAVVQCLGEFKSRGDAAFLIVLHGFSDAPAVLDQHLSRLIEMPVSYAENGNSIKAGEVTLCPPNVHLMVKGENLLLTNGPKENLFRPSIDVLFRSAAVQLGNRVIGVLLTGRLNDGTMGLSAIKRCGGITIIQDPASAEYADMPLLAQKTVNPDFVLQLDGINTLINRLLNDPLPAPKEIPEVLRKEYNITSHIGSLIDGEDHNEVGHGFSCPSCGGPLAVSDDEEVVHYRCRTGHSFTMQSLDEGQEEALEESLWIALRVIDERMVLLRKMINDYERKGLDMLAKSNKSKLSEVARNANQLKRIMVRADAS